MGVDIIRSTRSQDLCLLDGSLIHRSIPVGHSSTGTSTSSSPRHGCLPQLTLTLRNISRATSCVNSRVNSRAPSPILSAEDRRQLTSPDFSTLKD